VPFPSGAVAAGAQHVGFGGGQQLLTLLALLQDRLEQLERLEQLA